MIDPPKTPFDYSIITYLWVALISVMGGIANFFHKVKMGAVRAFNITEFVGEIFISAFTGMITFWLCEWAAIAPLLSAVLIAVSGHMGSRAIFLIEKAIERKVESKTS